MKKILRKIMSAAALTVLAASLTACGGSGEDELPPAEAIGNLLTFPITKASVGNAGEVIFIIKYDKIADDGVDESIKIKDAVIKASVNGTEVEMPKTTLNFALDPYGAKFDDTQNLKEYKVKPSLNNTLKVGDTVTFQLVSGEITGPGKDLIDLSTIVVSIIDSSAAANYYAELADNENEYQTLLNANAKPSDVEEEVVDRGLITTDAALDWGSPVSVLASKFADATNESVITVTYTSDPTKTDYYKFKMMSGDAELYAGTAEGITIDLTSEDADNLHGVSFDVDPSDTEATFSYTPSADEWTAIKENGFKLIGHGATITKIVLE